MRSMRRCGSFRFRATMSDAFAASAKSSGARSACERIDEPRHRFIGSARRHRLAKERHNLFGSGSPLALILGGRRHAEGLTEVFLMDPPDTSVARNPVVALDDDGALVTKMRDPGS